MTLAPTRAHEIPGSVVVTAGRGGLPLVVLTTGAATAEIYLHGAHVTHFQKRGEAPVLFLSGRSRFEAGEAIRGGVPICFPWFGARAGRPSHGLARLAAWRLVASAVSPAGAVSVSLAMPRMPELAEWAALETTFTVTLSDALTMRLAARYRSEGPAGASRAGDGGQDATDPAPRRGSGCIRVETCLHSYFHVGDIGAVTLTGLEGAPFDDFAFGANGVRCAGDDGAMHIARETNRVYPDHTSAIDIHDAALNRIVRVEKSGARSTVVWNPWTTQRMPDDFEQADYRRMVCVESGNVKQTAAALAAGESTALAVTLSSRPAIR